MFNPFNPQIAAAGVAPVSDSTPAAAISAMMGSVRGRVVGRGAPPVGVPNAPLATPSTPVAPPSPTMAAPEQPYDDGELLETLGAMAGAITQMQECLDTVRADIAGIRHKGSDSERVFDALHAEMSDYKRDFVFEHVKPMLRPMLFVFDALEEFDREMALYQTAQELEPLPPDALRAGKVRDNIAFVREQFEQALLACDVEPLPIPEGKFDAHQQKAVGTAAVEPELDGTVQGVSRLGWTIKGHVLRPTEVVVGRAPKGELQ